MKIFINNYTVLNFFILFSKYIYKDIIYFEDRFYK